MSRLSVLTQQLRSYSWVSAVFYIDAERAFAEEKFYAPSSVLDFLFEIYEAELNGVLGADPPKFLGEIFWRNMLEHDDRFEMDFHRQLNAVEKIDQIKDPESRGVARSHARKFIQTSARRIELETHRGLRNIINEEVRKRLLLIKLTLD